MRAQRRSPRRSRASAGWRQAGGPGPQCWGRQLAPLFMRRLQPSIRTHGPQRRRHSAKIRVLSPARPGGPVPGRGIRPAGAHLGPLLARNSRARTRDFTESSWRPSPRLTRSDAMPAAVSEESRTRQRDRGPGSLGRLRSPCRPVPVKVMAPKRLRRLSRRRVTVGGSSRCWLDSD